MSRGAQGLREAAHWFAVLQSGSPSEQELAAWRVWIADPEHARLWRKVEAISGQLQVLSADPVGRDADALLAVSRPNRRQALKLLGLLCGGGALTLAAGDGLPWREWSASQRSRVGEVRDLRLADGSRLWLNTDSALDVDFDAQRRRLALYRGEILLEAAADPRPLVLRGAHGRLVAAQAARFSLRQDADDSLLSVLEGRVLLQPADGASMHLLAAGRQQRFRRDRLFPVEPLQSARQAWTQGMLQADRMRLADFVAELSRYRRGVLDCDPRIADLPVVGAYPLADPERVLEALATTLGVRVRRRLPWWDVLEPAVSTG